MKYFLILVFSIIGYLVGSINPAYLISKYIYHTDLRTQGSKNLGGTNAGRVLGKKIGAIVIVFDVFKAYLVMALTNAVANEAVVFAGLMVLIGHSFPFYLNFKGGKSVASSIGFLLGIGTFILKDIVFIWWVPMMFFVLVLGLTKYVSLSSIVMIISATVISFLITKDSSIQICLILAALLIVFKHIPNIYRLVNKQESKITWLS